MSDLTPTEIATRLKEALAAPGAPTREALAEKARLSRSVVLRELENGIERARNPLTLARLALALGHSWDYLGARPPASITSPHGRALYTARLRTGWTLTDLAAAAALSPSTIHKIEHGRQPTAGTWAKLRQALGPALVE